MGPTAYPVPMSISTVFLDAGGVLVVPNWQRVANTLAAHGLTVSADDLAAADPLARHQLDLDLGNKASDQQRGWLYFNLILERAGVVLSDRTDAALAELQTYHARVNLWETVPEGVPEALGRFRAMGLTLAVVSNANGRLKVLLQRVGLSGYFDVLLDSHEEGIEKPDPRLFQLALAQTGAAPEETVHVGDLFHVDVEGARAAGVHAVLLDPLDLYQGYDCERVKSLGELADRLAARLGP